MTTTIRTLRACGESDDALSLGLRLRRAVGAADLRVRGLPPAAILCVRRMPDPLPGRLDLAAIGPQLAWEGAMRAALGRMATSAARPATGAPPPGTLAVRFEDRAELLACLARDWIGGTLAERWWWRTLLRGPGLHTADLTERLFAAWRATPEAIPAALALLHDVGAGVRFLAMLPPAEVHALTASIANAFGLAPPTSAGLASLSQRVGDDPPAIRAALRALDGAAGVHALTPERRRLYAAGLLLARTPVIARLAWPAAIERWAAGPDHSGAIAPPSPTHPPPAARAPLETPPALGQVAAVPEPQRSTSREGAPADHDALFPPGGVTTGDSRHEPGLLAPEAASTALEIAATRPYRSASTDPRAAEYVDTQLGGVMFLLNLTLHLNVFGDFTRPRDTRLGLSPWALLSRLGALLLPSAPNDDPLWALLGKLAGAAPEAGFAPPRLWRIPRGWRTPFGRRGRLRIARRAGWLQLLHPAGFVMLERILPTGRPARRQPRIGPPALEFAEPPDTLAGWAERLASYSRARLALALGGAGEVERALALPARIYAGDVRVDVIFPLGELPIAVRLAGLDRNPGWVPAAGRDIRFHFE